MTEKFCTKCEQYKPLDQFSKDKYKKSGKRNFCKACETARVKAYNHEHRDERNAYYSRRWFADVEESRKHHMECIRRNPNSKITSIKAARKIRAKYPDFARIRGVLYRKKKNGHPDIKKLYDSQNGKCYYCKCKLGDDYQPDHVIPLARGGSADMSNVVLSCPVCNRSKRDRLPHEWRGNHGRLI